MPREFIPDEIIDRAAELWARALIRPRFDNGDESNVGGMAMVLATTNAIHARDDTDDFTGRVKAFRDILARNLKHDRDHEGEPTGEILYRGHPGERQEICYLSCHIGTDYGPDAVLSKAAQEAGIPANQFSWKSTVYIGTNHVSASWGYGAPSDYHYPMGDGEWLVCRLYGEDMPAVIQAVRDGRLALTVDKRKPL